MALPYVGELKNGLVGEEANAAAQAPAQLRP